MEQKSGNVKLIPRKKEARHKRTVALELHTQWRELERKGDSAEIAKQLKVSKPTIDKALIYGCVHQQILVDGITKYFADRLLSEKETAAGLKEMQNKPAQAVA